MPSLCYGYGIMQKEPPTDLELPVSLFSRMRPWLGMLALVVASFVVYFPSLEGNFLWGDDLYVTDNEALRADNGLRRIWFNPKTFPRYEPFVQTSFWVQYQWHNLNPVPYRAFNLFFHILNGLLLLALLRYLKVPGAWLAVALFLLHPIQAESVAWIARRHNVMSLAFFLGALYLFCRAYLSPLVDEDAPPRPPKVFTALFVGGAVCFVVALLTSAVSWMLPLVLLLILWWKRFAFGVRSTIEIAALLVAGSVAGMVVASLGAGAPAVFGGTEGVSLVERLLLLGRVFWFYVAKLFVPVRFSFVYPQWSIAPGAGAWWILFSIFAVVGITAALQFRRCRGALVAMLLYVLFLLPSVMVLGGDLLRLSFVADHIPYVAGIGVFVLFSSALAIGAERIVQSMFEREQVFTRFVIGSLTLPFLGLLGVVTWQRAHVYANEIALWRDTIQRNPTAWVAYDRLAIIFHRENRADEGVELLRRAVTAYPEYENGLFKLAWLLEAGEQYRAAAEHYALVLDENPGHVRALIRRGEVLAQLGRADEAKEHWETALRAAPDSVDARRNLGNYYLAQRDPARAARYYTEALAIDPDENQVRFQLGVTRYRQKRFEEAEALFEETVLREPGHADAWNNRGLSLSRLERYREALTSYERAVLIRPSFARAWYNRGVVLEQLGLFGEAEDSYRRAIHLDVEFESARRRLIELEVTRELR